MLAHAPKRLHEELRTDYRDMDYVHAHRAAEVEAGRKAFLPQWQLRCRPSQWRSVGTTNTIEWLNGKFRRRIKTRTALPSAETVPMLLWALLASGQIPHSKQRHLNFHQLRDTIHGIKIAQAVEG